MSHVFHENMLEMVTHPGSDCKTWL